MLYSVIIIDLMCHIFVLGQFLPPYTISSLDLIQTAKNVKLVEILHRMLTGLLTHVIKHFKLHLKQY
jgi:hypothetical protein